MNFQSIIDDLHRSIIEEGDQGSLANYIPELAKVDPQQFGIYLHTVDGRGFGCGDFQVPFSIQSIAKVFSLTYAYQLLDLDLWKRLDVEPSGTPFNSLVQLEATQGIPRNPFNNAGALVICDVLLSHLAEPKKDFLNYLRQISGNEQLDYAPDIAASEASIGYRNKALAYLIKSFGNIHNDTEAVLDFYFHLCSIKLTCVELAQLAIYLANDGKNLPQQRSILTESQAKRVNAIMQTCGFYDESGEFTYRVGLPGKSGVGGGILAIHPDNFSIVVWSPRLNPNGNSYRGMQFLEQFTTVTGCSIF